MNILSINRSVPSGVILAVIFIEFVCIYKNCLTLKISLLFIIGVLITDKIIAIVFPGVVYYLTTGETRSGQKSFGQSSISKMSWSLHYQVSHPHY